MHNLNHFNPKIHLKFTKISLGTLNFKHNTTEPKIVEKKS